MEIFTFGIIGLVILAIVVIAKTATIVPQQQAYVIENLGKYSRTLSAGFHILVPFIERIAYKHSLKEMAVDIPEQICITKDNVQVGVDGVLYLQCRRRRIIRACVRFSYIPNLCASIPLQMKVFQQRFYAPGRCIQKHVLP